MENKNAAVGLDAFERGSQKLLMDIAMESSTRELQQLVGRRQEPVSLPGYYRSLQTWRTPVLHKVEA